ncbi:hypothetical protein CLF_111474 [Clonorchis sinensis]|uniref:ZSWIM1/3 RNaseH-like domain-containing protein n=1 Tax=Clonorchis sinensis TaxID=79923 RepID=G7YUY5_CLOSI|nr:hypothetical protein CLF_111474 [Clonorchis sinensis]
MASKVAAQAFVEKFRAVSFSSFTAFENALNQYMKKNYVVLMRSSSSRSTNAVLRYEWVYYKCCRYKLYTSLITDGMGIRRPVMYAFVESEQFASLRKLFGLFKEMMAEHHPVGTFVMDKLAVQMRAARVVFGCDVTFCYFHIRTATRKRVCIIFYPCIFGRRHTLQTADTFHRVARLDNAVQFQQGLQLLRRTDPRFVSHLTARWLYITPKWAVRAQSGIVHCCGVANYLGNAKGRLKDRVHHADKLELAIQKVSRQAEWLMRELEMHTSYHCEKRGQSVPNSKNIPFFLACFPIHQRWLSDYSLPEKAVLLTLVPKPPPTTFDALRKQLNRVVDKLQGLESRRATASYGGLGTHVNFCVFCDRPTTTSDRWCATDSVSYLADCYDSELRPLCGDAPQACPKASGPSRKRKGVLATRSAKRASYDVDLYRSAESQHSVLRKCVCVFGSEEELPDSQIVMNTCFRRITVYECFHSECSAIVQAFENNFPE